MAKVMDVVEKSLEDLEKEITCAVCQEHYTEPKVLPCLHYYCKQCILKLALRTGINKPFSCPECRKEATLPEGKEDSLPTAFFVNRLKALYAKQEKALSKEVHCEICTTSQVKAEAFCRQCDKLMCEKCVESHYRMKAIFDGHEILTLDEVKKVKAEDLVYKNPPAKKCRVHEELLKIFCFDCNQLICRDCTVKDHKDHNIEFNNIAAANKKKELLNDLKPLREVEVSLSHAVKEIQTTEHEVEVQGESVANTIKISFKELHAILERSKQHLLEEARGKVREKMENLKGQEKNVSIASAEVRSIIDYTEQCVRHCSDDVVMSMHAEITSRIKQEIEEHSKPGRTLEPVEDVDVGVEVRCAEALQQLCLTNATITQLSVNFVINEIVSTAEVNKMSEVTLSTTQLCNNKPTKHDIEIKCHINSLHDGPLIVTSTKSIGSGKYRIQYMPIVRGRHELRVSVDGKQVAGSPFPVFVSMSPTQLGKPVRVWGGINQPTGIAVNSVGEIIVKEQDGDVVVLDKEGKRLRSISRSQHQMKRLKGIAIDSEDNIYFSDVDNDRIFKSNKNCNEVQVHKLKEVKGLGNIIIAVAGDEVMVAECYHEGRIMIYDRELNYVRQIIVGVDNNWFRSMFSDNHSNLYVIIRNTSSIKVFSNNGDFLRSFNCDENGVKRLENPWSVCVAGQYVYVVDIGVDKIVVFTTEGDYVTSFGDGSYSAVCVDKDGFVYACNYCQKRIDIF